MIFSRFTSTIGRNSDINALRLQSQHTGTAELIPRSKVQMILRENKSLTDCVVSACRTLSGGPSINKRKQPDALCDLIAKHVKHVFLPHAIGHKQWVVEPPVHDFGLREL